MNLLFGTTNKSKIKFIQNIVKHLGINILSLTDVSAPDLKIDENGSSPLDNARIKALAYYDILKIPLFSCDSGLYIDGLNEKRQPGVNVRGKNDDMDDDETIQYYSALASEMGGKMTARYINAICLITDDGKIHEYMGDEIATERFYIVREPHGKRTAGFPLDSLSVHIGSGKYYYNMDYDDKFSKTDYGFAAFFQKVFKIEGSSI